MKILWFCNSMLPCVAKSLGCEETTSGSWITGLSNGLLKNPDIELTAAFPMLGLKEILSGEAGSMAYFGFPQRKSDVIKYNKNIEQYAETIIKAANPDIVHIFGTEYPHTLAIVNACGKLGMADKTLINIQGLVSVIARHYYAGLPGSVVSRYTLRDFIKQDNIRQQAKSFSKRGKYETEALKKAHHVSGRTDWDKACTSQINPNAEYHFCNETLRDEFYKHNWDITKCERNSIFISQAYYPVKGLHHMLEALPEIVKRFPDTRLYVAGDDITREGAPLTHRIKILYYGVYINKIIEKYNLRKHVTFTGVLSEKEMCERFLKSHVFVSASSIENSPNSLGEAMLLGVPSVSSDVGGVKNLMTHNEDGYIYQHDAPYMIVHYVSKLFEDDALALRFSQNTRAHARQTHDSEANALRMAEIYREIAGRK